MVHISSDAHYADETNTSHGSMKYLSDNVRASGRNPGGAIAGFLVAWIAFAAIIALMPLPAGLSSEGRTVLAVVVWASIMWVSEAMPVGITGISIPALLVITKGLP